MSALKIYDGHLDARAIFDEWLKSYETQNFGAFVTFVGIVRAEGDIEALSFDIYEPLLVSWFEKRAKEGAQKGATILMAHSKGDVPVHTSSFVCAVLSPKRRAALETIDWFVEDFKANAPIWKYDVKGGQRVYAEDRSSALPFAGLLS